MWHDRAEVTATELIKTVTAFNGQRLELEAFNGHVDEAHINAIQTEAQYASEEVFPCKAVDGHCALAKDWSCCRLCHWPCQHGSSGGFRQIPRGRPERKVHLAVLQLRCLLRGCPWACTSVPNGCCKTTKPSPTRSVEDGAVRA